MGLLGAGRYLLVTNRPHVRLLSVSPLGSLQGSHSQDSEGAAAASAGAASVRVSVHVTPADVHVATGEPGATGKAGAAVPGSGGAQRILPAFERMFRVELQVRQRPTISSPITPTHRYTHIVASTSAVTGCSHHIQPYTHPSISVCLSVSVCSCVSVYP